MSHVSVCAVFGVADGANCLHTRIYTTYIHIYINIYTNIYYTS